MARARRKALEKEPEPPKMLAMELRQLYGHMLRWRAKYGFECVSDFIALFDNDGERMVDYYVEACFDDYHAFRNHLDVTINRKGKTLFVAVVKENKIEVYRYTPQAETLVRTLLDRVMESLGEVVELGPDPFEEARGERREGGQLQG